jgi:replicative DNA helicase
MLLACAQRNVGAGLVSVEDPEEITGSRLIATVSGVSSYRLQRRDFQANDWDDISKACLQLEALGDRLLFADCTGGNELDVCAAMTRMAMRGAKVIAVDYIGEIESSKRQQDRRNEIRWLLKRLKTHAKRLGIALVIVSQIARPKDKNPNQEPTKHDLKEAGDLENSAEVIVGLWRDVEHDFAPVNVKILKSKIGGTGQSWLMQREKFAANGKPASGRLRETEEPNRGWYAGT